MKNHASGGKRRRGSSAQPLLSHGLKEIEREGQNHKALVVASEPDNDEGVRRPQPRSLPYTPPLDQFAPLEAGRTKKMSNAFAHGWDSAWKGYSSRPDKAGQSPMETGQTSGVNLPAMDGVRDTFTLKEHSAGDANRETTACKPLTMADLLREQPVHNGPHVFEPGKLKNMGFVSSNNGIPSIYFSGAETRQLAENMGHAIVGKFSHSITATQQIQNALDNMKVKRGISWKYINAKHILIQLEDLADYAQVLSGPKGTPVWFVDRHPMRVFKWSPDFDVFCESPIAAIWCNLIGLPIHLFDASALFAIGKTLGNPIQIDKATTNKSRLSFARMCIEIDITKPVTEEIILDLCGKEIIQQVKWDKIPAFCAECKHVGHTETVCYTSGKRERPEKRNYNNNWAKKKNQDIQPPGKDLQNGKTITNEWQRRDRNGNQEANNNQISVSHDQYSGNSSQVDIPDIMEPEYDPIQSGSSRRNQKEQGGRSGEWRGSKQLALVEVGDAHPTTKAGHKPRSGSLSSTSGKIFLNRRAPVPMTEDLSVMIHKRIMSANKYYSLMENGEFDTDIFEEEGVPGMDILAYRRIDDDNPEPPLAIA